MWHRAPALPWHSASHRKLPIFHPKLKPEGDEGAWDRLTCHLSSSSVPALTADHCQHQLLVLNNNIVNYFHGCCGFHITLRINAVLLLRLATQRAPVCSRKILQNKHFTRIFRNWLQQPGSPKHWGQDSSCKEVRKPGARAPAAAPALPPRGYCLRGGCQRASPCASRSLLQPHASRCLWHRPAADVCRGSDRRSAPPAVFTLRYRRE